MQLDYALALYLHRYGKLPLPGAGHISIHKETARLSFPDRKIYPAHGHILFSVNSLPEFHLLKWLSSELEVDYHRASELMNEWVSGLVDQLKSEVDVIWEGVGRFYLLEKNGAIQVDQEGVVLTQSDKGIHADKVIRTGTSHVVLVGESEKSSEEMEEVLHKKKSLPKKITGFILIILFVFACASVLLASAYFTEAWKRKGNHHPIKIEETPSRNQWIP